MKVSIIDQLPRQSVNCECRISGETPTKTETIIRERNSQV